MRVKVLLFVFAFNIAQSQSKFAFIPFEDMSKFKGRWNLKLEIPRYLGDFLMKFYGVEILPVDSVIRFSGEAKPNWVDIFFFSELNKWFGVRYVIGGKILVFNVSRFATGFPEMAGYESYSADVEIEIEVYNTFSGERVLIFGISGEVKEQGLGLTLLGKPTEKYTQFYSLDLLRFGSKEFNQTIIGKAMNKAGLEFAMRLKGYIPEAFSGSDESLREIEGVTELKVVEIKGKILHIGKQNLVYINLGSGDGLVPGVIAYVYDIDKKIADIEVVDVVDSHLSACKVLNSFGEIRKDFEVRVKIVK
ncbi:hypothetical protein JGI1_00428 [Candidatus Thermokryptus mobilis]|uniref:Uncharacterized protein n=1 Tax=Candidatus Thermokryptus mobilis TaxID=1643428 RepID=A0A0S4MSY1_9BACT|nr:hypothetical protein [Candidatus Thermokryptus mobilis]CUU02124.1 hypothetical protein JGI1_00428 [Candidatus Thermokryptus mobilis]